MTLRKLEKSIDYEVIKTKRKSISLSLKPDGAVLVRAPLMLPDREIARFVSEHSDWIEKHRAKLSQGAGGTEASAAGKLSESDIAALKKAAALYFAENTRVMAARMGLSYGRISIRLQKTRWGSCSSKKNLNFNCLLMLCPEEVRLYVIVHELCHLRHMDHSKAFWDMVSVWCPDYKALRKWLRDGGNSVMKRVF